MKNKPGKITIAPDANIWPHEYKTAQALALAGMTVEFIRKSEEQYATSADVLIDGFQWEMKSPKSDKLKMVQKNLRLALRQSHNVIFDSRRMKNLPDSAIEREVRKWGGELRAMKHLIYVNRSGGVVRIK